MPEEAPSGNDSGRPDHADPRRVQDRAGLAVELTMLKDRSGLSYRAIARGTARYGTPLGLPFTTIRDYMQGRSLPSAERLDHIVQACGVADPAAREEWRRALQRAGDVARRPAGVDPYRGLAPYRPEDAAWFHGRERLVTTLLQRLAALVDDGGVLTLVGPSGAGKTSLLRAGLIPALRRGELEVPGSQDWPVRTFTPGSDPTARLVEHLAAVPGPDTPDRAVLVIDQFEELFGTGVGEAARAAFLSAVARAVEPGDDAARPRLLVVLGLRSDFVVQAMGHGQWLSPLAGPQVSVDPMTEEELRAAIVAPAAQAGFRVAEGLVELLLSELRPDQGAASTGAAHTAGALPLLSHALAVAWTRARHGELTVADYRESGGIRGAAASIAEDVFSGLSPARQQLTRCILLRLVRLTPDAGDTRRRATRTDLLDGAGAAQAAQIVDIVDRFVAARLLTVDATTVEIAHEVLLSAWPRLGAWLQEDRDSRAVRSRLTEAARAWRDAGRDSGALLRGRQLAAMTEWATSDRNRGKLLPAELSFLDASRQQHAEEQSAQRRQTRRLRAAVGVLAVLVLLVGALAGFAFGERAAADRQRDMATSRQLAIEADRLRASDPSLAMQLALAAYRISPTAGARSSLLDSTTFASATRILAPSGTAQTVAFTPDAATMVTVGADETDTVLRRWSIADPRRPVPLGAPVPTGHQGAVYGLAISPDGRTAATGGVDHTVRLWDIADPAAPVALGGPLTGPGGTVYAVAFSPDGRVLAAGSDDGGVYRWDVTDVARPVPAGAPTPAGSGAVRAITFASTGALLAAGYADGGVRLWNLSAPAAPSLVGRPLIVGSRAVYAVAFTPDGRRLAAAGLNRTVQLWDVSAPAAPRPAGSPLTGPTAQINGLAISADGTRLAAAASDNQAWTWDLTTGAPPTTRPHPGPVTQAAFVGGRLVTVGGDGTTLLWTGGDAVITDPTDTVFALNWSKDGRSLAVGVGGTSRTARLWDVRTRTAPVPLTPPLAAPPQAAGLSGNVALSPDRRTIVSGATDGTVQVWDVSDPAAPVRLPRPLVAGNALVEVTTFSPDGRVLAVGSDDQRVRLFDMADPRHPALLSTLDGPASYVFATAFSPNGRLLAAASADKTVRLWDITDPARPRPLGAPLTGTRYAYSVAFSPDGRYLATGSADKTVRLWDLTDPARPAPVGAPLTGPNNTVLGLDYTPDGRLLTAAAGDGTVWLWDVADPARPETFATLTGGFRNTVWTVGVSPDGQQIAAAGADHDVRLWLTDPEAAARWVCATAGDPITPTEWAHFLPETPYTAPC